jgi:hypothetical protein
MWLLTSEHALGSDALRHEIRSGALGVAARAQLRRGLGLGGAVLAQGEREDVQRERLGRVLRREDLQAAAALPVAVGYDGVPV